LSGNDVSMGSIVTGVSLWWDVLIAEEGV
jgi:hypothetical protein